jgi:hypothetical protein
MPPSSTGLIAQMSLPAALPAQKPSAPPIHLRFTTDPPSFRDVPIAELIVGERKTSILIHKSLLCDAAPFFNAALTTGFLEAAEQQILLPEDDADTVNRFVQWIYFKSYGLSKDHDELFMQLARLYLFANKVLAYPLKNDVIRALFYLQPQGVNPPMPVIAFAFDHMPEHSPFRKLLVDWYAWHADLAWYGTSLGKRALEMVPIFTVELTSRLAERIRTNQISPFKGKEELYFESTERKLGTETATLARRV